MTAQQALQLRWAEYHPPRALNRDDREKLAGLLAAYADATDEHGAHGGWPVVGFQEASEQFDQRLQAIFEEADRSIMRRHLIWNLLAMTGAPPADTEESA